MDGWVQACANGRVGCMGGFIDGYGWFYGMGGFIDGWVYGMGGFMEWVGLWNWWVGCRNGKVVMYNFGGGPRGDPLFQAF